MGYLLSPFGLALMRIYSVGVMLYEAITGRLPFSGRARDVLSAKLSKPAPPVQQLLPEAPPDLAELCARLLERSPALRPAAAAILDRIQECAGILPRNAGALARAFPVLRRAGAFAEAATATLPDDPIEQRRQAAGALRELLANLSRSSPVVIAIDDLQWGGADSASLIAEAAEESAAKSWYKTGKTDIPVFSRDRPRLVSPLSAYSTVIGNIKANNQVLLYSKPEDVPAAEAITKRLGHE